MKHQQWKYKRKAVVVCGNCDEKWDSDTVEFLDIYSDMLEKDVMVFKCPKCGQKRESHILL